jgi:chromosomal replication initiator protein
VSLRDFVRDENNRAAYRMLLEHGNGKGLFDPFLVHGPTGCGKTHLLRGFLDVVSAARSRGRSAYLTAEAFGRAYRASLYRRRVEAFRAEMDAPSVLVIDDLGGLAGLEGTQREVVRLLERRGGLGHVTVFGARDLPDRISGLIPPLATRLDGGLVVGMKPARAASVVGHLKARLAKRGIRVERGVLERAVELAKGQPLTAETMVLEALVGARAARRPLTVEAVTDAMPPPASGEPDPGGVDRLAERVSAFFGVTVEDLRSPRKVRRALAPRRLLALGLRRAFELTSARIGRYLGGRSVSTVTAMLRRARADIEADSALGSVLEQMVKDVVAHDR